MLQVLAACSAIIWMRTFCLVPYKKINPEKSVFEQSFIRTACCKSENNEEETTDETPTVTFKDVLPALKSFNIWQFTAYYTILSSRTKSIQGWIYPWMDWVYANHDASDTVSNLLNLYGYSIFLSPLVALFPGIFQQNPVNYSE